MTRSCDEDRVPQVASAATAAPPGRARPAVVFIGPVIGGLVVSSMVGVLIRVYLTRLFTYPGEPIYGLVWAQMVGCFIMGVATRTKGMLVRWSPALNTGVTTGLCGSVTTFSSWQLLVFEQFFNTTRDDHSHFRNFLGGMSVLVSTMACSVGALRLGQMVGDEIRLAYGTYLRHANPELDALSRIDTAQLGMVTADVRRGWLGWNEWRPADMALAALGVVAIIAASVVVGVASSTRSVSIALLFGCVGTLARWRLASLNATPGHEQRGKGLSRLTADLPLGTLIANVAGSAVLAIVYVLQTGAVVRPSAASCYVLKALADGFCGCLTTISTFVVEVTVLRPRKAALYAAISIVATQPFFLFVAGIYFKTAAVDYPTC